MTRDEKQKAIDALKISAPVIAMTQEEFNDYIQTLNQVMNWLEQEPKTEKVIKMRDATPEERESVEAYIKSISKPTGVNFWALEQTTWIPCSERYPQTQYKHFLVTDDKGKVSIQEFYLSLDKEPRPYFSGMVNVIAWMPLPEPYRAESEVG